MVAAPTLTTSTMSLPGLSVVPAGGRVLTATFCGVGAWVDSTRPTRSPAPSIRLRAVSASYPATSGTGIRCGPLLRVSETSVASGATTSAG